MNPTFPDPLRHVVTRSPGISARREDPPRGWKATCGSQRAAGSTFRIPHSAFRIRVAGAARALTLAAASLLPFAVGGVCGAAEPAAAPAIEDPFAATYRAYRPPFLEDYGQRHRDRDAVPEDLMKLSSETSFYTLNLLTESDRADALVKAGKEKEAEGRYGEALEIYQKVIDDYPEVLHRVSGFGVFVPITEYCQLRILKFPKEALELYRTKHDARAKEAFELARQRNSLEGLAEIRDRMLCTSAGAPALTTLGYSALDQGHYLEALEYFESVWNNFPDARDRDPALPLSIALCRKMLGIGTKSGERYGLLGHWKLDEGSGNRAADSSGYDHHGTFSDPQTWIQGKVGGALHVTRLPEYRSNCVNVPATTFMNIGVGGADFSVAFWLNWETGSYPNSVFTKRGRSANDMLNLEVTSAGHVRYTLATQNPTWETGVVPRAIPAKTWVHVGFVKVGQEVKLFLDGKLELRDRLKALPVQNLGGVTFGQSMEGAMDDVRLYGRALLDREVAEFAGAVGTAALTAAPASGEAPLTVEFSAGAAEGDCLWEFGDGETGKGAKVKHTYGIGGEYTALLAVTTPKGSISVGRAKVSVKENPRNEEPRRRMAQVIAEATYDKPVSVAQRSNPAGLAADDYLLMPPPADPMGVTPPAWEETLPGSMLDFYVYSQPVVTENSVVYRHKNILYSRSILTGTLRWQNDLGGRVTWQNWPERQYPQEDILVQDGLVITPLHKVGPTLVALDEITGRLRWAYGPMVAATPEEASLRFEAAPAGGPRTVYASYVLDNIEGDTHTDTEYGVMAFESATGRLRWRSRVCQLRPGQFSAGFAVKRRNKILSFTTPPLYHEGTLYYCSNAGALAAIDALSGRIRWVARYPYYAHPNNLHDATQRFGRGGEVVQYSKIYAFPHDPMFWYNQRPLLVGDKLFVLPVDSPYLFCVDRRSGKVLWNRPKAGDSAAYLLGPMSSGELVMTYTGRNMRLHGTDRISTAPIHLLNPDTGDTVWQSPDIVLHDPSPVMNAWASNPYSEALHWTINNQWFGLAARPFLTSDDAVYVPSFAYYGYPIFDYVSALARVDLRQRRTTDQRRYYSGRILGRAADDIQRSAPQELKLFEDLPHKDDAVKARIQLLKDVMADSVPVNAHGPFLPFSRITFTRYDAPFELRFDPRRVSMVYDRPAVKKNLAGRTDPAGMFARAELATADADLKQAANLMNGCLDAVSSEDLDFRALVNQQLYRVYKDLARGSVRTGRRDEEIGHALGMSRTVGTLSEEIETLFALSEAYGRRDEFATAARLAQSIVSTYGQYEYPTPSLLAGDPAQQSRTAENILDGTRQFLQPTLYGKTLGLALQLTKTGVPLYLGALSPIDKDLSVRAGELASAHLARLGKASPEFARQFEKEAAAALEGKPAEEQLGRLWEYPATEAGQKVLDRLFAETDARLGKEGLAQAGAADGRKRLWLLADAARISSLRVPPALAPRVHAPAERPAPEPLSTQLKERSLNLEEERQSSWLVLERQDDVRIEPDLLFLGGRVKKKFDNKFLLYALDMKKGEMRWKATEQRGDAWFDELRLKDKGDEPGFFEAFVCGDSVLVCGRYDVLSFALSDGKLRWRYLVPFDFEIRYAVMSGDLLALAGQAETVVLYIPTRDPRGEVVWQEKEEGDLYVSPYFHGDRLVSVRKLPFNVTIRYRSTGRLMGRLDLPDLLLTEEHPLLDNGPQALPWARDGEQLVVSDGWYYLAIDVEKPRVIWKRLIDENDVTQLPRMRFALSGDHLVVVKRNYDVKAIFMLSARTGEVLWRTDPKQPGSPQPIYSMVMRDGRLYGIRPHAGQGFYFVGMDCATGKELFRPKEQAGYGGKPEAALCPELHGQAAVIRVRDRQDFELRAFDVGNGNLLHTLKVKSAGDFGEHGRASATAQNGRLALFGKNTLVTAGK